MHLDRVVNSFKILERLLGRPVDEEINAGKESGAAKGIEEYVAGVR